MSSQLVYHERQAAALCGCHALNNLVQTKAFTEFDLADIALELDAQERTLMLANGVDSEDAVRFLAEGSTNVDDSGNFSITVLREALSRSYGIELSAESKDVDAALRDPAQFDCYILNLESHWFSIRKLYGMWFNLNSMNKAPEFIGEFYLAAFLAQMKAQGYYIFVAKPTGAGGRLPAPQLDTADATCLHTVADIRSGKAAREAAAVRDSARRQAEADAEDDPDLAAALAESLSETTGTGTRVGGRGATAGGGARTESQGYTMVAPRPAVQLDADGFEVYDPSAFESPGKTSATRFATAGAAAVPTAGGMGGGGMGTGTTSLPRFDFSGVSGASSSLKPSAGTTSAAATTSTSTPGSSVAGASARSNDVVRAHWAAKYPKASPAPAPAAGTDASAAQSSVLGLAAQGSALTLAASTSVAGAAASPSSTAGAGMKRAASDMSIVDESAGAIGESGSESREVAASMHGLAVNSMDTQGVQDGHARDDHQPAGVATGQEEGTAAGGGGGRGDSVGHHL